MSSRTSCSRLLSSSPSSDVEAASASRGMI
jgi:hypothetical protein